MEIVVCADNALSTTGMEISALQVLFSSVTELKKSTGKQINQNEIGEKHHCTKTDFEMQWKMQKRGGSPPRQWNS
jgi:hypothetical protein